MDLGLLGENLATRYLQRKGFKILERNHSSRLGEIDLIVQRKGLLVFCEVKTRLSDDFGQPFEAVTVFKQNRLRRLAKGYLATLERDFENIRFDVISILLNDNREAEIEHIENAF